MAADRIDRRDFLKGTLLAGSVAAIPAGAAEAKEYSGAMPAWQPEAASPPAPLHGPFRPFFTDEERAFATAAVDRLIPKEPDWPGASDLGVVVYIEDQLAGSFGRAEIWYMQGPWAKGEKTQGYQSRFAPAGLYRKAIAAIDAHCRKTYGGKTFAALSPDDQDAVLKGLDEAKITLEGIDGKTFFDAFLQNTIEGYFGDPIYGGNRDMAAWRMIGFPGARYDYRPFVKEHNKKLDLEPVSVGGITAASISAKRS